MKRAASVVFALAALPLALALCGFSEETKPVPVPTQGGGERDAQDALPQSKDPLWTKLAKCKLTVDEQTGNTSISLVPEVKAFEGQTLSANGFILPLDASDKTKHFLLSRRTPVCLFCPPGAPNEVIEVYAAHAFDWDEDTVTLKGRFKLINDGEKGYFFQLLDAEKAG